MDQHRDDKSQYSSISTAGRPPMWKPLFAVHCSFYGCRELMSAYWFPVSKLEKTSTTEGLNMEKSHWVFQPSELFYMTICI